MSSLEWYPCPMVYGNMVPLGLQPTTSPVECKMIRPQSLQAKRSISEEPASGGSTSLPLASQGLKPPVSVLFPHGQTFRAPMISSKGRSGRHFRDSNRRIISMSADRSIWMKGCFDYLGVEGEKFVPIGNRIVSSANSRCGKLFPRNIRPDWKSESH